MSKGPIDPLVEQILANVMPTPMIKNGLSEEEKVKKIAEHFREIMMTLGLDLADDSLAQTPDRVARMYVGEIFAGLSACNFPKMTSIENKLGYNEMVTVKDVYSTQESDRAVQNQSCGAFLFAASASARTPD